MLNACTIDVEDYFQVSAFDRVIDRSDWEFFESRVEENTRRILAILDSRKVRATFFVLGWQAQRSPNLIREIHEAGHEIGCHGFGHHLIYQMTPADFREDLTSAKDILERIIGKGIYAYRAPSFSITPHSLWALEILAETGFRFDSSIFPIHHDRYGMPDAPIGPYLLRTSAGPLIEFPPTVHRRFGLNLPVAGGGYFRLYPYRLTRRWATQVNQEGRPINLYIHPWEFDPRQPRIRGISAVTQWRHYVNLGSTARKFDRFLADFSFGSLTESLGSLALEQLPTRAHVAGRMISLENRTPADPQHRQASDDLRGRRSVAFVPPPMRPSTC